MATRTRPAPAPLRGTADYVEALGAHLAGVNARAQLSLDLGVDVALDTSALEPAGAQLDMFGGAL